MIAATLALVGMVLSGPLAVAAVNAVQPQPAWQGAELYARSSTRSSCSPIWGASCSWER
jgi:hypothetical protein